MKITNSIQLCDRFLASKSSGKDETAHGGLDSDSNPNLLELNRDDKGEYLNAYNGNPENTWNREQVFVFLAPQLFLFLLDYRVGEFCFMTCPCHPPSILPIASSFSDTAAYLAVSRLFISHAICKKIFAISSLRIALWIYAPFSCF